MNRFTLKQLKYFVTVVETESIAEASRQLHIAQPSISIAIKTWKAPSTSSCLFATTRRAYP
jgi:DNA-binding transcriptional LysR family regulator